jgi:RNA polymerase sigma factor (sigma-70 family)
VDDGLLTAERNADLEWALEQLPERSGEMLRLLMGDEQLSYAELSERLGIPIGSIGPTRARTLRKLQAILLPRQREEDD